MKVLRKAERVPSFSTDATRRSSNRDQNYPTYRCSYVGMRAGLRRRATTLQPGQRLGGVAER